MRGGRIIHGRSGNVALFLVTVVLNAAARWAGAAEVAFRAERRALDRSIVVDILIVIVSKYSRKDLNEQTLTLQSDRRKRNSYRRMELSRSCPSFD